MQDLDDPIRFANETCGVSQPPRAACAAAALPHSSQAKALPRSASPGSPTAEPAAKRIRKSSAGAAAAVAAAASRGAAEGSGAERPASSAEERVEAAGGAGEGRDGGGAAAVPAAPRVNPIDHIFQFHKARFAMRLWSNHKSSSISCFLFCS